MLYFIYQRLGALFEWIGRIWRAMEEIRRRQKHSERQQDQILRLLEKNNSLLQEIRDAVIPEPATTLHLIAGPIEEQPL